MRIIVLGDRIWGNSAYSKVVHQTCTRLRGLGHSVAHIPMGRSMRGAKFGYKDILVYPSGNHPFAEDVAIGHYVDYKADMLITIKDSWVFNNLPKWAVNWVPMVPIEHSPVSPAITGRLKSCPKVISISRHGQRELKREKNIDSTYIPHGVDTSIFKPLGKREQCRDMWFFDQEEFAVGFIGLNRSRKMIPRMLRGYKRFLELNPDAKSHLFLWTDLQPPAASQAETPVPGVADVGVNLLPEIVNLDLRRDVRWPDPKSYRTGIPDWAGHNYEGGWDMVKLYNCLDVLLFCTGGEGFGFPLIEAQSCGVPVVTTDYAAGPEQVGVGLTVKAEDYIIMNTPGTRYALADIDDMARALTKMYNTDREKLGKKARRFALRYDWDNVMTQYFQPFIRECEEEFMPLLTGEGVETWA